MKIRRLQSITAICLLTNAYFMYGLADIDAYAEMEIKSYNDTIMNCDNIVFTEDREEYSNINKKIDEEINSNTKLIDENTENYLNESGVYDSEIEKISDVELLDDVKPEDIQIFTGYFAVVDTLEKADIPITDDELEPISGDELNALFGNIYYDENNDLAAYDKEGKIKSSAVDKILMSIGIKPINAYADYIDMGGKYDSNHKTYLKKTLIAYPLTISGKKCIKISYFSTWETMPKYRNVDVVSLYWTNATWESYLQNKTFVQQSWNYETHSCMDGQNVIINRKTGYGTTNFSYYANPGNLKQSQYFISSHGIIAAIKLHEDTNTKYLLEQRVYDEKIYSNEELLIEVYLEKEKNKTSSVIYPYYQHYKSKASVKNVVVSAAGAVGNTIDGNIAKAVYILSNGLRVTSDIEYSGVTFSWVYNFK